MSTGLIVSLVIIGVVACLALAVRSIVDLVRVLLWVEDNDDVSFRDFLKACFIGVPVGPPALKVIHEGELVRFENQHVPAVPTGDCSALCCSDFTFTKLVFADGKEILLPGSHQPESGKRLRVVEDGGKYRLEDIIPPK